MSFLAGRLAATEGAYFLNESKSVVGRLAQKLPPTPPPSLPVAAEASSRTADVLPEILRHNVPLKGTSTADASSLSASSKWLVRGSSSSSMVSLDSLNPLRAYVSLPQVTFGPKRWVEGMAPVFSRSAWQCVWHLIQNDLVHGWGLDMKLGYCAQNYKREFIEGDRTKKVGVIDTEFIVHKGIPTLGGSSKVKNPRSLDLRTHIRRQSTLELKTFRARWNKAVKEDGEWENRLQNIVERKE